MTMQVVITGANRGLGLAFTAHYLAAGAEVWAGHRSGRGGLDALARPRLHTLVWDVAQAPSAQTLAQLPERIDLLINNAGIYGPQDAVGQSLQGVSPETLHQVFDIDCIGPLRVVQALRERLIAARGRIANIGSKMGSSDDNHSGGCYAYRAAKAALCIVSRSMAVDLQDDGVRVITLHPGWVRTDMTAQQGEIDAATSVAGMARVIADIDRYPPGAFVAWDGSRVPF